MITHKRQEDINWYLILRASYHHDITTFLTDLIKKSDHSLCNNIIAQSIVRSLWKTRWCMFAANHCHHHYHNHHHRHMMVITTNFKITLTVAIVHIFEVCDPCSVLALLKKQRERPENFRPEWDSKRPQKFVQSALQMQEFHVLMYSYITVVFLLWLLLHLLLFVYRKQLHARDD